jgi:hypothetical protein
MLLAKYGPPGRGGLFPAAAAAAAAAAASAAFASATPSLADAPSASLMLLLLTPAERDGCPTAGVAGTNPSVDELGSSRGVLATLPAAPPLPPPPAPPLLPPPPPPVVPAPPSDRATARPTRPSCRSVPERWTEVDPMPAGAVAATPGATGGIAAEEDDAGGTAICGV